jgi:hypothetical protein
MTTFRAAQSGVRGVFVAVDRADANANTNTDIGFLGLVVIERSDLPVEFATERTVIE